MIRGQLRLLMDRFQSGPTPLYQQLASRLREQIAEGTYRIGDRLPSEDALGVRNAPYRLRGLLTDVPEIASAKHPANILQREPGGSRLSEALLLSGPDAIPARVEPRLRKPTLPDDQVRAGLRSGRDKVIGSRSPIAPRVPDRTMTPNAASPLYEVVRPSSKPPRSARGSSLVGKRSAPLLPFGCRARVGGVPDAGLAAITGGDPA